MSFLTNSVGWKLVYCLCGPLSQGIAAIQSTKLGPRFTVSHMYESLLLGNVNLMMEMYIFYLHCSREDRSSLDGEENMNVDKTSSDSNGDLKRKQPEVSESERPSKSPKEESGARKSSPNNTRGSHKQTKREKLDWNVLRPPKSQNKREQT